MTTISAASLAEAWTVQTEANTNKPAVGIVTLPVAGCMINSGGTVINDGSWGWLCACYPGNPSTWDGDAWRRAFYVNAKQPIIFVRGGKPRVNLEEEGTFQRKEGSTCMRHAIAQKRGENGQDDYSLQRKRIVPHMQEPHQINFLKKQWYRSSKCSHTRPCDADDQGCIPCHCFHLF